MDKWTNARDDHGHFHASDRIIESRNADFLEPMSTLAIQQLATAAGPHARPESLFPHPFYFAVASGVMHFTLAFRFGLQKRPTRLPGPITQSPVV